MAIAKPKKPAKKKPAKKRKKTNKKVANKKVAKPAAKKKQTPKAKPGQKRKKQRPPEPQKRTPAAVRGAIRDIQESMAQKGARVSLGTEYHLPHLTLRRPTGVMGLDVALGGGFAAGGPVQLVGEPSSGKTTLLFLMAVQNQIHYGDMSAIAVAMTDHRLNKMHAKRMGVKTALSDGEIHDLEVSRKRRDPEWPGFTDEELAWFKEQIGTGLVEIVAPTAELLWEAVLEAVQSNVFQIIGVDSLGSMLPTMEAEGTMEDKSYGGASAVNTQFMHKYTNAMCAPDPDGRSNETTLVLLNQYRVKMDSKTQAKFATKKSEISIQGGNAVQHAVLQSVYLESGAYADKNDDDQVVLNFDVKAIKWNVLKDKIGGSETARGSFPFRLKEGVDLLTELVRIGVIYKVVHQAGAGWFSLLGETRDPSDPIIKCQGIANMKKKLIEMPNLVDYLRHEILKSAGIEYRYGPL